MVLSYYSLTLCTDINSYLTLYHSLERWKIKKKKISKIRTSTILRNINIDIIEIGILLRGQFNSLPENRRQLAKEITNEKIYFTKKNCSVCIGLEPFDCNKAINYFMFELKQSVCYRWLYNVQFAAWIRLVNLNDKKKLFPQNLIGTSLRFTNFWIRTSNYHIDLGRIA